MFSMITFVKNSFHGGDGHYPKSRTPPGLDQEGKPCRACNDFKTWFRSQNVSIAHCFLFYAMGML